MLERLKEPLTRRLVEIQRHKLERLLSLLRSYIKKHRYDVKERIGAEEAEAWMLAVEALKGKNLKIKYVKIRCLFT